MNEFWHSACSSWYVSPVTFDGLLKVQMLDAAITSRLFLRYYVKSYIFNDNVFQCCFLVLKFTFVRLRVGVLESVSLALRPASYVLGLDLEGQFLALVCDTKFSPLRSY